MATKKTPQPVDLVDQAPPAAPAAPAHPAPSHMLPSSRAVALDMPDLFAILGTVGTIPSPLIAAVIDLLVGEGSYKPESDPRKYRNKAEHLRGMYGVAALCMTWPRLDLSIERGASEDVLGRRDLPFADVEYIYWSFFRHGHEGALLDAADPAHS